MIKFKSFSKSFLKYSFRIGVFIVLLFIISLALLQLPKVQTYCTHKAMTYLSKKLGVQVNVDHVSVDYLTNISLNGVLMRDQSQDTMIFVDKLNTNYSILSFKPFELDNKDIDLKGVKMHLVKGVDSVLNINKVFGKNKKSSSTAIDRKVSTNSSTFLNNFRFKKLHVEDFELKLTNLPRKQVIHVKIDQVVADLSRFKLMDSVRKVNSLDIENLQLIFDIKSRLKNTAPEVPEYLDLPLNLDLDKLKVGGGSFVLNDVNFTDNSSPHHMALNEVHVKNIQLEASKVAMRTHCLQALISNFSCKESSGLELTHVSTNFYLSSYKMIASQLTFNTGKSHFKGNLRFDYSNMIDYLHFCNKVKIQSNFQNSTLHLYDLGYFVKSLLPYQNDIIHFDGNITGLLNDLNIKNFKSTINSKAILNGDIHINSLFPIDKLTINANLKDLILKKEDIEQFFPAVKLPTEVAKLGAMNYKGNLNGSIFNFVANGTLNTAVGLAEMKDVHLDTRDKSNPKYKGYIKLNQFELASLVTMNPKIDHINCAINIEGEGFEKNKLNTKIQGTVSQIEINNTMYSNIDLDGKYSQNVFTGQLISNDPSLSLKTNGVFSFQNQTPNMKMNFDFNNLDLKKLKLTTKNLFLYSKASIDFEGKNIDDMLGEVDLKQLKIVEKNDDKTQEYLFSDIHLLSKVDNAAIKTIQVHSNELDGQIKGLFKPSELGQVLQRILVGYLQLGSERNQYAVSSNTYFDSYLTLHNIKNYSTLFVQNLKNIDSGNFTANFNGKSNIMDLQGDFSNTTYDNFFVPHIVVNNHSTINNFNTTLNIE